MPGFPVTFSSMRAPDNDDPHSPFINVPSRKTRKGGIWPGMCPSYGLPGPYSTHTHVAQAGKTAVGQDPLVVPCLGQVQREAIPASKVLEWPKLQVSRSVSKKNEDQSNKPLWHTTFVIFQCEGCGGCCYGWPRCNVFSFPNRCCGCCCCCCCCCCRCGSLPGFPVVCLASAPLPLVLLCRAAAAAS